MGAWQSEVGLGVASRTEVIAGECCWKQDLLLQGVKIWHITQLWEGGWGTPDSRRENSLNSGTSGHQGEAGGKY